MFRCTPHGPVVTPPVPSPSQEVLYDENSDEQPPTAVVSGKLDELLTRVRQKSHTKRSLGKIPFILGEGVKMAVGVYNLIR